MISLGGLCVLPWMSSASGKHNVTLVVGVFRIAALMAASSHSAQTPKSGQ